MSYLEKLKQSTHDDLVNMMYTTILMAHADYDEYTKHNDIRGYGMRIPSIGLIEGRSINFTGKKIRIVRGVGLTGITTIEMWTSPAMPNRLMTEEEADKFIEMLEAAYAESDKGVKGDSERKFCELWDWMQTLGV